MDVFMRVLLTVNNKEKDLETINGRKGINMKDFGKMMCHKVMVNLYIQMETFTKEIGKMAKLMDMENIFHQKEFIIRDSGKMMYNMGRVLK